MASVTESTLMETLYDIIVLRFLLHIHAYIHTTYKRTHILHIINI